MTTQKLSHNRTECKNLGDMNASMDPAVTVQRKTSCNARRHQSFGASPQPHPGDFSAWRVRQPSSLRSRHPPTPDPIDTRLHRIRTGTSEHSRREQIDDVVDIGRAKRIRMQLEYGTRERGPTCFKDSASETSTMPPVAAGNSMLMVDALIANSESEADEPERFALTVAYGRTSDDGHILTKRDLFDW